MVFEMRAEGLIIADVIIFLASLHSSFGAQMLLRGKGASHSCLNFLYLM